MANWVITYWVEFLFGILSTIFVLIARELRKQMQTQKAIKEGVRVLLYESLHKLYDESVKELDKNGGLSVATLDRVNNVYKQYKALGGNHTGDEIYCKIKHMKLLSIWEK